MSQPETVYVAYRRGPDGEEWLDLNTAAFHLPGVQTAIDREEATLSREWLNRNPYTRTAELSLAVTRANVSLPRRAAGGRS